LEKDLKATSDAAESSRSAAVGAQEAADSWRKGFAPNSGPVLSLTQVRDDHNQGYKESFDTIANTVKTTHTSAEQRRQDAVDAQGNADAWRAGWTPSSGPLLSLHQRRAIPDGYTFNYDNLETSIKNTHDAAEAARSAAVAA
jgi:hypothetical protein